MFYDETVFNSILDVITWGIITGCALGFLYWLFKR
jgi:hypothetical protein